MIIFQGKIHEALLNEDGSYTVQTEEGQVNVLEEEIRQQREEFDQMYADAYSDMEELDQEEDEEYIASFKPMSEVID